MLPLQTAAANAAFNHFNHEEKIAIKVSRSETVYVFPSSISHIEASDKYSKIYLYENQQQTMIASSHSLKQMQQVTRHFMVKVGRSFLVNPHYRLSYNSVHGELMLTNKREPIIIPRRFKVWMALIFGNE